LDGITAAEFEGRFIVGVGREAKIRGISLDEFVMNLKNKIATSGLSDHLRLDVLSKLDCFAYHGLDVVRIVVPGQEQISFLKDKCFSRQGSSTISVPIQAIPDIVRRFQ
jgi:hypothetical protein